MFAMLHINFLLLRMDVLKDKLVVEYLTIVRLELLLKTSY